MVGGPGTAWPAGATLIGLSGPRLRQVGITLAGIGFLLFFLSFVPIFLAFNSFMQNPFGSTGSMFGSFFLSFVIGALGIILIGVGGLALRLGLVRPVTGYVATEAAPAIQTAATAFGAGLREAGFGAWSRRLAHPREVPQLRIPRNGRRRVLQQVRPADVSLLAGGIAPSIRPRGLTGPVERRGL